MPAVNPVAQLIAAQLPAGAYAVHGGRDLYMEVTDTSTGKIWMSAAPVSREDFDALEVAPPLVKLGCASASMDAAAFIHSPDAPDAAVLQRDIEGRRFINVATAQDMTASELSGGPILAQVNKAHVVGFAAGRSVVVMSTPEGDFVELVGDASDDTKLVLPPGATLKQIALTRPWVVTLPNPTQAYFWMNQSVRSFQGPVTLPEIP